MILDVIRYEANEWREYASDAHKLVFKELRPAELDRISYALLCVHAGGVVGYVTCRELDAESLYWQYGGALDECRGALAVRGFRSFLSYTRERYRRVTTLVSNGNIGYLHLAMKEGFRIIGTRCFKGEIFVELFIEFEEK